MSAVTEAISRPSWWPGRARLRAEMAQAREAAREARAATARSAALDEEIRRATAAMTRAIAQIGLADAHRG